MKNKLEEAFEWSNKISKDRLEKEKKILQEFPDPYKLEKISKLNLNQSVIYFLFKKDVFIS